MPVKKKTCELLLMLTIGLTCLGKEIPDNQGKEFIIGFMEADEAWYGDISDIPLKLFITTASEVPVSVNVSAPMSKTLYHGDRFTVKRGTIKQISIPKSLRVEGTWRAKKAIHIVSSDEIVVFGINQARLSTDGFLGMPLDVLGTKYFVPSFYSTAQNFYQSSILIAGTQDNTKLNIKLPMEHNINIHLEGKSYNQGDWINMTVNKYDTLQLLCHADLTGTVVLSSEKVSVFGGSTITSVGVGTSRDHIEEQIPPVNVWGKSFAINPFPDTNPNVIRFLASEDDTIVNIDGKASVHISAGNFHELEMDSFSLITSNKPVLSVQYVPSGTCKDYVVPGCHKGDPAMTLIPPIEQSNIFYSFLTPVSSQNSNYKNIFMFFIEDSYESGILLDNKRIKRRAFHNVVHRHNLSAGYVDIPPGGHTIEHSSKNVPFGGILYGGIQYESYAFPVGQRFATINKKECSPVAMTIGDGIDNDCDGQVDEEICNDLQDDDKDGQRDEDCFKALSTTKTIPTTTTTTQMSTTTTSTLRTPKSTTIKINSSTTVTTSPVPATTISPSSNRRTIATPKSTKISKNKLSPTIDTATFVSIITESKTTTASTSTKSSNTSKTMRSNSTTAAETSTAGTTIPLTITTASKSATSNPSTSKTSTIATSKGTVLNSTITAVTTTTTSLNTPVRTLSPIDTNMTNMDEEPEHPAWLSFAEYGIIGCVSAVIIGGIGVCCKKCLGLLSKRDNDEDEEHRRKMYKKARQAFGAPAIRPMYIENKKT